MTMRALVASIVLAFAAAPALAQQAGEDAVGAPTFQEGDVITLRSKAKDMALEQIPMKTFGLPVDIANAVAFLASEASGYITGQVISVDGGMHT